MTDALEHIRIMDAIEGAWEHAVVASYNADLQFFERAVLPRLNGPRNAVVLVDRTMLGEAAEALTHGGGSVSQVNATYVAAPTRAQGAAHAKFVLLVAKDRARLLVGSGNLTYSGYNATTEVFARFDADRREPGPAQAFFAVRELLDGLIEQGRLDGRAAAHLPLAWQQLTWLDPKPQPATTVVHNLTRPIMDAFIDACDTPVERLTVHSPFWDPGCQALAEAVDRLRPAQVHVLLQDGLTHLDLERLSEVLDATDATWQVRPISVTSRLVHAKLLAAHHGDTATLLAGSANASTPALLRTVAAGNIELATISRVPAHHLDALFAQLGPAEARDTATLQLLPPAPEPGDADDTLPTGLSVHHATWDGVALHIEVEGGTGEVEVSVGAHAPMVLAVDDGTATLAPEADLAERLDAGSWVRIRAPGSVWSAPTFPYRVAALARQLEIAPGRRQALRRVARGTPDVDDDVAALLSELENTMLTTERALKDLASQTAPAPADPATGADLFSSLDQVWAALEQTPQLAQYRDVGDATAGTGVPTDLAVILAALGLHLPGGSAQPDTSGATSSEDPDGVDHDTEGDAMDDLDEDERAALQQRQLDEEEARIAQTRRHYARFYKRVAAAYKQPEFLQRLGPVTVATQLVVHLALLARLLPHRHADPDDALAWVTTLLDATLTTDDAPTVLRPHPDQLADEAEAALATRGWWPATVRFLLALDAAAERDTDQATRRAAAALTHRLLTMPIPTNNDPFATVAADHHATATELWARLHDLARRGVTPETLRRHLEQAAGAPPWAAKINGVVVTRPSVGTDPVSAEELRLPATADPPSDALRVIGAWAALAPDEEYFRLVIGDGDTTLLAVRDRRDDSGWVYDGEDDVDVDNWPDARPAWLRWLEMMRPEPTDGPTPEPVTGRPGPP